MKRVPFCLFCLLLAGCGTSTVVKNGASNSPYADAAVDQGAEPKAPEVVRYHHEIMTEYSDGATKFLVLVPNSEP
jgi:hypothetical protein